MKKKIIENIIQLRTAVALLGEKREWWNSNFFDPSSQSYLSYIFPKSQNTQLTCAIDAIQHAVDAEVGANFYHLYRLNVTYEELINSELKKQTIDITDEQSALDALEEIAGSLAVTNSQGPKNIGNLAELNVSLVQAFAAEYLAAFNNNYVVHPYLN